MYYIRATLWHNTSAPYGIATHPSCHRSLIGTKDEIIAYLKTVADNVDMIKLDKTVGSLQINTDDRHIFQVAGYGRNGMYNIVL